MTDNQKMQITMMRERGETYASIAEAVKVSQNTVKSYCLRHDIRIRNGMTVPRYQIGDITKCEQCGAPVFGNERHEYKQSGRCAYDVEKLDT